MNLTAFLPYFQTIIAAANIVIIAYGFYKFLGKPRSTIENRVAVVESKVEEIEGKLKNGNKRFEDLEEKNKVFMNCMLAFIDFEIAYCTNTGYEKTEDLMNAKAALREYISKR